MSEIEIEFPFIPVQTAKLIIRYNALFLAANELLKRPQSGFAWQKLESAVKFAKKEDNGLRRRRKKN